MVVSFSNYRPPVRYDAVPWADARIYEAAAETGPWALIDTKALTPLDADPTEPSLRSFTTTLGTGPDLWYRVIFADAGSGVSEPTVPVQNSPTELSGRALITLAYLKDWLPTFTDGATDDDDEELRQLINSESDDFLEETGREIVAESSAPATRVFDVDEDTADDRHIYVADIASITTVTIKDENGTVVDATPSYATLPRNRKSWEPIEELWFRDDVTNAAQLDAGSTVEINAVWGWPEIPERVRQAVRALVAIRYLSGTARGASLEEMPAESIDVLRAAVRQALDVRSSFREPRIN